MQWDKLVMAVGPFSLLLAWGVLDGLYTGRKVPSTKREVRLTLAIICMAIGGVGLLCISPIMYDFLSGNWWPNENTPMSE